MRPRRPSTSPAGTRRLLAEAACACLGVALLIWGLAPAIVERIVARHPPTWQSFALGSAALLVGLTFIGLHRLVRRQVRWALWAAFGTSLVLVTGTVVLTLLMTDRRPSLFLLIFSTGTTIATWLALREEREGCARGRPAQRPARES